MVRPGDYRGVGYLRDLGEFFGHQKGYSRREGILSRAEVQKFADNMISAQPMLGTLAADPSPRGVFDALDLFAVVQALPKCSLCPRLATRNGPLDDEVSCDEHAPGCPDLSYATALRALGSR